MEQPKKRMSAAYRANFHAQVDVMLDGIEKRMAETGSTGLLHTFTPGPDAVPNICILAFGITAVALKSVTDKITEAI